MMKKIILIVAFLATRLLVANADVDPNFYIYICFGQSNMEGNAQPESIDKTGVDKRFQLLATCNFTSPSRTKGKWYTATPPLVSPNGGLGPSDYFGRTMVECLPENVRVGVIPVAMGGSPIEMFDKDKYQQKMKDNPSEWWVTLAKIHYGGNPYGRIIEMAKEAQKVGVIKGILLHQGCSNNGDSNWPNMVKKIYNDMLSDLGLGTDSVPLFVGETLYQNQGGSCYAHNTQVARMPSVVPTSHIVSADGCLGNGIDPWHFNAQGYRMLGSRYATEALNMMGRQQFFFLFHNYTFIPSENCTFDEKTRTINLTGAGMCTWTYHNFVDWSDYKYLVVKLKEPQTIDAEVLLYGNNKDVSYCDTIRERTSVVIDLHNLKYGNSIMDPSMVYKMAISSPKAGKIVIDDVFLSNPTQTPTFLCNGQTLTINCTTEGAVIYYSLDGSTPTQNSTKYDDPITLTQNCTVKAIAVAEGYLDSEVASYTVDWLGTDVTKIPLSDVTMYNWDGYGADAKIVSPFAGAYELNTSTSLVYGDTKIRAFADLSPYSKLEISYTEGIPRILINRDIDEGQWNPDESQSHLIDNTKGGWSDRYFNIDGKMMTVDLQQILKDKGFVHLHAIKGGNWSNVTVTKLELVKDNNTAMSQTDIPKFSRKDNVLTISSGTEQATIYYTLDGTTPTTSSHVYISPITLTQNCIVKAIAVADGYDDSEIANYTVDWFKVEDVSISFVNLQVILSTTTANARIYYTTDGNIPTENSIRYTEPFSVSSNCTVKVKAFKDNFTSSEVTSLYIDLNNVRCNTPTFQLVSGVLTISTLTEGAKIYYTLDGTTPTTSGMQYTDPVTLIRNGIVKAIAMKDGYLNSEVSSYEVTYFQVEMPSFTTDDNILTIFCGTQGASIYYVLGEGALEITEQNRYVGPITLTDNRVVRAVGVLDGYRNSEEAVYRHNSITCGDVAINFDGHYVRMSSATEGATIYYTTNGSNPTSTSTYYTGPVAVDELCTINAIAIKENMNNSKVAKMELAYVYDGTIATVKEAGLLSKAFEWQQGTSSSNRLEIRGQLNATDIDFLKTLSAVEHLDMKNVTFVDQSLPNLSFSNMNLVSIELPAGITQVGKSLFCGCNSLASIIWNANLILSSEALEGFNNPNLLVYANALTLVPTSKNVVSMVNDRALSIVLHDVENGNFYCPRKFTAQQISYTRNFKLKSGRKKSEGWETIALPFSVATITHEHNGLLAPFGSNATGTKPFWLYSLQSTGFNPAMEIVANTPYIICMPNHEDYADEYNQGGNVTFSATNVEVPVSSPMVSSQETSSSTISLIPTFSRIEKSSQLYAINREAYGTLALGSVFIQDSRDVYPFEAYSTVSMKDLNSLAPAPLFIPIFDDNTATSIVDIPFALNSTDAIRVYSLNGLLIKTVASKKDLNKLPKGIYLVNDRKVVIK